MLVCLCVSGISGGLVYSRFGFFNVIICLFLGTFTCKMQRFSSAFLFGLSEYKNEIEIFL